MGKRYIEVPATALRGALDAIGDAVTNRGGSASVGTAGREVVYDLTPHKGLGRVRVFTSLTRGADSVRECGADAIRIVVGHREADGRFRPHGKGRRIFRTAPRGTDEERLNAFLGRLTEALRTAYGEALRVPHCPKCEGPMALRTVKASGNKFWGCSKYPECNGTRNVSKAADGRQEG